MSNVDWADLEEDLNRPPAFYVEEPDGRKDWSELPRQATFRKLMYMAAPQILLFANPNAGKRNPMQARKEGILGGVFDMTAMDADLIAWVEFKGYSGKKYPRPGVLSPQQIRFGNRLHDMGRHCACFYSPHKAVDWLRDLGFPIREVKG